MSWCWPSWELGEDEMRSPQDDSGRPGERCAGVCVWGGGCQVRMPMQPEGRLKARTGRGPSEAGLSWSLFPGPCSEVTDSTAPRLPQGACPLPPGPTTAVLCVTAEGGPLRTGSQKTWKMSRKDPTFPPGVYVLSRNLSGAYLMRGGSPDGPQVPWARHVTKGT